ncbi:MAG: Ku protein, partial [Rubrivivax sp.]|nr:Ku protein [Rubrivivax sp.]
AAVHFNMLHNCGSRLKQQYVCLKEGVVVERADMIKGYEFDKDRYVTFTPPELKALEESARHTIDIISFIPNASVDPIYYDKAYYLAPDKRGAKPYHLLMQAMVESGRCALARWAWKGKQYVVQVRPAPPEQGGLILQQLLYADEVRSMKELEIERADIAKPELQLALQLIDQIAADSYDPAEYKDEEKARVLAAIDEKIAGKAIVVAEPAGAESADAKIIDLTEALRASLGARKVARAAPAAVPAGSPSTAETTASPAAAGTAPPRKAAKRASVGAADVAAAAPADTAAPAAPRARARKQG